MFKGFNSRSRVGSDNGFGVGTFLKEVSIRAPAWGATLLRLTIKIQPVGFNSRSRVGSDRP